MDAKQLAECIIVEIGKAVEARQLQVALELANVLRSVLTAREAGLQVSYYFWGIRDEELSEDAQLDSLTNRNRTHDDDGREIEADGFVTIKPEV